MNKAQLEKIISAQIDSALNSVEHPKKFFITENGRGVVDGGDLYNALLKDVLGVVKTALVGVLEETLNSSASAAKAAAPASAAKTTAKTAVKK